MSRANSTAAEVLAVTELVPPLFGDELFPWDSD